METGPENIATIIPVPLTIRLFTPVNASIIGVKITPPPIPAITDTIAIIVLSMKKAKRINAMVDVAISPSTGASCATDKTHRQPKLIITAAVISMLSSQGDFEYLPIILISLPVQSFVTANV